MFEMEDQEEDLMESIAQKIEEEKTEPTVAVETVAEFMGLSEESLVWVVTERTPWGEKGVWVIPAEKTEEEKAEAAVKAPEEPVAVETPVVDPGYHTRGNRFVRGQGRKRQEYVVGSDGAWRKVG